MKNKYDNLILSPNFPESVYENLPEVLVSVTNIPGINEREKDILLLSSIIVLSGCFSDAIARYGKDGVHPNLFCLVVTPPASGKGIMKFSRLLGSKLHNAYVKTHADLKSAHAANIKQWSLNSKRNPDLNLPQPEKPKLPVLYIPGNISSTSFYSRLKDSNETGIIFETEADTLSAAIKQDWGNFSHLFRIAFHHEPLSLSRVQNDLLIDIHHPRLSVLLSGTPDQVARLISSTEDGLMSRFLFYCYSKPPLWESQKPCDVDVEGILLDQAEIIFNLSKLISETTPEFYLTDKQFDLMDAFFPRVLNRFKSTPQIVPSIFRFGIMGFRIAMILSLLRQEKLIKGQKIECSMQDFERSFQMIEVLIEHTTIMYNLLPGVNATIPVTVEKFYDKLPKNSNFESVEANKLGELFGVSERTVSNYLKKLKESDLVEDVKYGVYRCKSKG